METETYKTLRDIRNEARTDVKFGDSYWNPYTPNTDEWCEYHTEFYRCTALREVGLF